MPDHPHNSALLEQAVSEALEATTAALKLAADYRVPNRIYEALSTAYVRLVDAELWLPVTRDEPDDLRPEVPF